MKKLKLFGIISLFISFAYAQESSSWCATDAELKKFHEENPELKAEYEAEQLKFAKSYLQSPEGNKANNTYIIPVVVHVIHYNGQGNITKNQIDDGMRIINEDFQKLNSDTSAVRSVFQPYIADLDIEFRLAKIDPLGNCTEGVTRTNSDLTFDKRNEPKSLVQWDPFSYLNVWIVNSIRSSGGGANTLGFAQFPPPSSGTPSTYGLVVRADEWGGIELASGTDGRTVTHEIGHCLNLLHTFQGSCGSFCQGSGDFICDTPPQFDDNNNSCSFSFNTCSNDDLGGSTQNPNPFTSNVPDQLENYMGYGLSCLGMFTEIQKNRVYSAITSYNKLIGLTDPVNNVQTGTNDGYVSQDCVPIPEILDFEKFVCEGGQITFNENSYGGPISTYNWSFPGGTPSTSTQMNPNITYNTPGEYDISLRVSNSAGADSVTLTDYVHVGSNNAQYGAFNYSEGFENATSFNNDWTVVSPSGAPTWERISFASKTGSSSMWVNNKSNTYESGLDQLISPSVNMTNVANPSLSFEVAYQRVTSSDDDRLRIKASVNCGETWLTVITLPSSFIVSRSQTSSSNFVPTSASDWKTVNLPGGVLSNTIKNSTNVRFMFELINGGGNNVFLDDFQINGTLTGLDNNSNSVNSDLIMMYPNPATNDVTINLFAENSNKAELFMTDILGKRVTEIYNGGLNKNQYKFNVSTENLDAGIYFVTLITESGRKTEKLIVR